MSEGEDHTHNEDIPSIPDPLPAVTAFMVLITPEGKALAYSDINTPVQLQRMANLDDMYGGCAQVMRDVELLQSVPMIAQAVINGQMQMAQQIQQQKLSQKLIEKGMRLPPQ